MKEKEFAVKVVTDGLEPDDAINAEFSDGTTMGCGDITVLMYDMMQIPPEGPVSHMPKRKDAVAGYWHGVHCINQEQLRVVSRVDNGMERIVLFCGKRQAAQLCIANLRRLDGGELDDAKTIARDIMVQLAEDYATDEVSNEGLKEWRLLIIDKAFCKLCHGSRGKSDEV